MSTMKYSKRLYWTVTGLMAAFMLMASIPDILQIPQAVEVFTQLGYPTYLLPFVLGVIAVLAPVSGDSRNGRTQDWSSTESPLPDPALALVEPIPREALPAAARYCPKLANPLGAWIMARLVR